MRGVDGAGVVRERPADILHQQGPSSLLRVLRPPAADRGRFFQMVTVLIISPPPLLCYGMGPARYLGDFGAQTEQEEQFGWFFGPRREFAIFGQIGCFLDSFVQKTMKRRSPHSLHPPSYVCKCVPPQTCLSKTGACMYICRECICVSVLCTTMYVRMYVCKYVCMYVCMYVCRGNT